MTFTKLFASITESTVWAEPDPTRIVWITMLAMSNKNGFVFASLPGLAHRARVSIEACDLALKTFLAPDPYSRSKEHEGRRIEVVDGGWRLLNYQKHRDIRDEEDRRTYQREYQRDYRKQNKHGVNNVNTRKPESTHADADADAEAERASTKTLAQSDTTSLTPVLLKKKESVQAQEIEEIYRAYPRKVGRRDALKAIRCAIDRLVAGSLAMSAMEMSTASEFLLARTQRFATSPSGATPTTGKDFRPHPATWFNGERYFDQAEELQKPNGSSGAKPNKAEANFNSVLKSSAAAMSRISRQFDGCDINADFIDGGAPLRLASGNSDFRSIGDEYATR